MSVVKDRVFDYQRLMELGTELLEAIGEDPAHEGLKDTPRRWAEQWREFVEYDPGKIDTTFEATSSNGLVIVSGMRIWSICEHHLLPFYSDISVGYIVRERTVGLSKFARLAHKIGHRLQLQERITQQLADAVVELSRSPDVIVASSGVHMCMTMRGVKTDGKMISVVTRGCFVDDVARRMEFHSLTGSK